MFYFCFRVNNSFDILIYFFPTIYRYYKPLAILIGFVLPTLIPWLAWSESLSIAYFVPAILRYIFLLHMTWLVNSVAHMWGDRPYDKSINPAENLLVSIGAVGEGFHNYHHTFPQDYAASEFGTAWFNPGRGFIDLMSLLGQAYDRKTISAEMVAQRRARTGDGSNHAGHLETDHDEHEFDYMADNN